MFLWYRPTVKRLCICIYVCVFITEEFCLSNSLCCLYSVAHIFKFHALWPQWPPDPETGQEAAPSAAERGIG